MERKETEMKDKKKEQGKKLKGKKSEKSQKNNVDIYTTLCIDNFAQGLERSTKHDVTLGLFEGYQIVTDQLVFRALLVLS